MTTTTLTPPTAIHSADNQRPAATGRVPALGTAHRPVTVPAAEFFTALANVVPFTNGVPAELPTLATVRIEVPAGRESDVDIVATDRYRLGWHRITGPACTGHCGHCDTCHRTADALREPTQPAPSAVLAVNLDPRQARAAIAVFGHNRRRRDPRTLTLTRTTTDRVRLASDGPHPLAVELTDPLSSGAVHGRYPDWRRMFTTLLDHPGSDSAGLAVNPRLLASFATITTRTGRGEPMRLRLHHHPTGTGGGPVRIDIGAEFTGLLMPMRIPSR